MNACKLLCIFFILFGNKLNAQNDSIISCYEILTFYERGAWREKQGKFDEAMVWYEKAFENPETGFPSDISNENKANLAYKIAYNFYQKGDFSTARTWLQKASNFRPNWGEPYLLIGSMYASSGKLYSDKNNCLGLAPIVVWAAMDEWELAKKLDTSCTEIANTLISKYQAYLPTAAQCFIYHLQEGDTTHIDGWINKTTTVRCKKIN